MLDAHPERVDLNVLKQFPGLEEFRSGSSQEASSTTDARDGEDDDITPEEAIEKATARLNRALLRNLLDWIQECTRVRSQGSAFGVRTLLAHLRRDRAQALSFRSGRVLQSW